MRGEVISIDSPSGDGLISGDDGQRYSFASSASRTVLRIGDKVDFAPVEGAATDIIVLSSVAAAGVGVAGGHAPSGGGGGYDFASAMFKFEGRLRRSHYWISWLILLAIGFVVGLVSIIIPFANLLMLWPQLATQVKRLHDMGRSGWWAAAPIAANLVGLIILIMTFGFAVFNNPQIFENEDPATIMAILMPMFWVGAILMIINLGFWLWIGIADTQPGRNQYGPDPKNPVDDTANTFT